MRRTLVVLLLLTACASPQERLAADLCEAAEQRDFEQVDQIALQAEADGVPLRRLEAQARLDCGDEIDAMQQSMDDLRDRLQELREELGG